MQLVAYGAQDVYLTGNPQITFMKVVYRRHTNFAMESIDTVFSGQADFGKKVTATISRNGDLIHKVYLMVELPDVDVPAGKAFRWLDWVGHALIKSVEIEIGGQRIDKHYGDWLHIWNELTQTAGHQIGYANMVGHHPSLIEPRVVRATDAPSRVKGQTLYIPLEFWFNRNPGLSLPLIALQYHEVKINIELNDKNNLCWIGNVATSGTPAVTTVTTDTSYTGVTVPGLVRANLLVDYIYLDTDERRRFAQSAHEYLVEQLAYSGEESYNNRDIKVRLNFNHPCKELVWVVQPEENVQSNATFGRQWFNYTDTLESLYTYPDADILNNTTSGVSSLPGLAAGGFNAAMVAAYTSGRGAMKSARLLLNGHDRLSERDGRYFNLVQPYQHHENVPKAGIYVYSFALKPEEHQPSGSCNMSRIDNATLSMTLDEGSAPTGRTFKVRVYAVNYNVLRIMSGMGGLAYSN